ncbi:NIPSNAP family protein [Methylobacterium sp. GC_Met_2]|uniref:NIPSNAP family protein n=1 Tax=Methylobacterium sp. GC_Met_2 TaxID=2937376 RepID=UPI00226B157D|nr:NIPSNAP family protein [Methylobacterium sp. GC_Met_2]
MLYELATLSCPLLALGDVCARARAWTEDAEAGTLLGCWRTDIGTLGRVLVLRGFDTPEAMTAERRRALMSIAPFHGRDLLTAFAMESYRPFPFLPPLRTGSRGGVYEIRTYRLRPGGLVPTLAAWEAAIEPARTYTDHLVTNLYALDGPPRITHIWAFSSLEERARLRGDAYAAGIWPPKGGPDQILEATSTIALPDPGSPLS